MSTLGRLVEPSSSRDIVLKTGDGRRGHLPARTSAATELGAQNQDTLLPARRPAVGRPGRSFSCPGSNALDTADGIKAKMQRAGDALPAGPASTRIVYDTTPFIRESVDEVFKTLRDAVILVAIVVLLFLQDWKALILPRDRRGRVAGRHLRRHEAAGLHA